MLVGEVAMGLESKASLVGEAETGERAPVSEPDEWWEPCPLRRAVKRARSLEMLLAGDRDETEEEEEGLRIGTAPSSTKL
jgi:hypothetical protein